MDKTLKYIGISHKSAIVSQREKLHISDKEKEKLIEDVRDNFKDITGLFILATCNRTEIYFESTITSASVILDFFIGRKIKCRCADFKDFFNLSNNTIETTKHILEVAAGLESSVLGDAEIVHQIKDAYQFSVAHKIQGSLLERALQSTFKSHKRISNETHFRDGTTSVAYKSLKVVRSFYGKKAAKTKNILFIGAGDIVMQLFKYNSKFNFKNIYISNRTQEKADVISNCFKCKTYDWDKVLKNEFENFDVIISAAGNCRHLIKKVPQTDNKLLLLDLAIPSNINKASVSGNNIVIYDLDSISEDLEETKEKRLDSIDEVKQIISEELAHYQKWLDDASLRRNLIKSKSNINQKVIDLLKDHHEELVEEKIEEVTNKVMRKLMAQSKCPHSMSNVDTIIAEQACLVYEE